ncbi:uncharacterized protein LOC124494885 [Dermatophagoides farinae]|uniref:uncharacterized protein LOC124494885 n=1 Tax=Dermatophagoides farinae TaxID=6954 RepID=UPI001F0E239A|nr:uncharacterized protein LOC124494885 [Dermatophagoides farinae]
MFFESDFRPSAPFITVVATFIIFIVLICLVRLFISPYILMTVYDDCNFLNYQHQYVLRLLFAGISSTYEPETTTVTVRIDHSIRRCRDIPFMPEIMDRATLYKGLHCAKIFIRTCERYQDIKCVTLYHNGRGSILVDSVELQDVDQANSIIATVQFPIGEEHFMQKVRAFPFGREKLTEIEDDIRPTSNVTCLETYYFIYASLNIIYALNAFTFMSKCSQPGAECRLQMIFVLGLISCGLSCAAFILLILPFRYVIKVYYHNNMGRGFCKLARFVYLLIVLLIGFMTAGFACELSTKNQFHRVNEANHLFRADTFWLVTTGFSVFLYFCVVCMAIPLAICINYIQLPSDQHWRQQLQDTWARAQRHGHGHKQRRRPVANNRNRWHSYRSDEAQSLVTSRNQPDNKGYEDDRRITTTTDTSTDMDSYYNMLIKRKNEIKSISTFVKPGLLAGGIRRHFKRQQRQTPVGATIAYGHDNLTLGKYHKPTNDKPRPIENKKQPARNDSLHQFSSAGEDYYQLMLKHQKVRSVSQYKALANK